MVLHIAGELARQGVHAFVFDYRGTGDSSGDHAHLTYKSACKDAKVAAEEFADIAGDDPLTIVGIRLGANVALTIADAVKARHVVVWDPIEDGRHYLAENRRLHHEMCQDPYRFRSLRVTPEQEILGFSYSETALKEVADLNLETQLGALKNRRMKISGIAATASTLSGQNLAEKIVLGEVRESANKHWENYRLLELALTPGAESRFITEQVVAKK